MTRILYHFAGVSYEQTFSDEQQANELRVWLTINEVPFGEIRIKK